MCFRSAQFYAFLVYFVFLVFGVIDREDVRLKIESFIKSGLLDANCVEQSAVTVGVILDGSEIITSSYGLRDRENSLETNKDTLFGIGSTSKAMTAIITDKVLKDNNLSWDEPIIKFYPNITFLGPERKEKATFRDLYSHSMCLSRDDFWWATGPETFDVEQLIHKTKFISEVCQFRSDFVYNNLMFVIGAHIVEILSNKSWCTLIQEHIFKPLQMNNSKCSFSEALATGNIVFGYDMVDGKFVPLPRDADRIIDLVGEAGSIHSTSHDMMKYIQHLLDSREKYKDIFWKTSITFEQHLGSTDALVNPPYPVTFASRNYTIAWLLGKYNEEIVLNHGGDTFTTHTFITLSDTNNYGIFVSATGTNFLARQSIQLITWYIQDLLNGKEPWLNSTTYCTFPEPWTEKNKHTMDRAWGEYVQQNSGDVRGYTGIFNNIVFGNISISYRSESGLFFKYNRLNCTLRQHRENKRRFRCHVLVPYYISDTRSNQLGRILRVEFSKDGQKLETDMTEGLMHEYVRSGVLVDSFNVYLLLVVSMSICINLF